MSSLGWTVGSGGRSGSGVGWNSVWRSMRVGGSNAVSHSNSVYSSWGVGECGWAVGWGVVVCGGGESPVVGVGGCVVVGCGGGCWGLGEGGGGGVVVGGVGVRMV